MAEPTELTANQELPYPDETQHPADVPLFLQRLAEAVEKKLVLVYDSAADRSSRNGAPAEGQLSWLSDVNRLELFTGTGWTQLYPSTAPTIHSGTSDPTTGLGSNGDLYFKYS